MTEHYAEKAIAGEVIPADVMEAACAAHADFARSSVTDNLTTIIARAIMAERERCASLLFNEADRQEKTWNDHVASGKDCSATTYYTIVRHYAELILSTPNQETTP